MGVDGIHSDRSNYGEHRPPVEEDTRDPRFRANQGFNLSGAPASAAAGTGAKPLLGDDRLQLSPKEPANPFAALVRHRQRRRRKQDGDPSTLD